MSDRFPEKRLFVTGAGSGLGLGIARRFAAAGWRVAVTDSDAQRAESALEQVRAAGGEGLAASCDVRSADELRAVAEKIETDWGGVDVVVNNAGVAAAGTIAEMPLEDWDWVLDINLMGVVRGCHVFAPMLTRQGSGHFVNIASLAAIAQAPTMAAYNVAKIGVLGLSETLRAELAPAGVGVTVVCPSFVKTNLMQTMRSPDPHLESIAKKLVDTARWTPERIADHVYYGVMKNRFMILPQADARWSYRLKRLSPGLFLRLITRQAQAFIGRPETPVSKK